MNTNKLASIIIIVAIIISIGIIFSKDSKSNGNTNTTTTTSASNVEIKDGIQYVTINAKGGYFPRTSSAKAGVPTKLIMKTQGTYDCSAYLIINSLGYQNMLPSTGDTIIDAGATPAGETLRGTCGMGMYGFSINFN